MSTLRIITRGTKNTTRDKVFDREKKGATKYHKEEDGYLNFNEKSKEEGVYDEESEEEEECDEEFYKEEEYNMSPRNNDWKHHDKPNEADINEDVALCWNHDVKHR